MYFRVSSCVNSTLPSTPSIDGASNVRVWLTVKFLSFFFTYVFVYNANAHSHSQSNSHFHSVVVHIIYFSFTDTFFYVDWQLWRCDMVLVTGAVAWSFFAIHIFYHPRLHTARAQNRRVNFSMGDSAFFLSYFLSVVLCTHNAFCDAYGLFFFLNCFAVILLLHLNPFLSLFLRSKWNVTLWFVAMHLCLTIKIYVLRKRVHHATENKNKNNITYKINLLGWFIARAHFLSPHCSMRFKAYGF